MKPLIQALTKAKLNFSSFGKDGEAKVKTKSGYEYSYRYSTYDDIMAAVNPALAKEGLHVYHTPRVVDRSLEVTCHVTDGEFTLSTPVTIPLSGVEDTKNPAQAMASVLTYGKRYSICAVLGISATEDDDAQSAGSQDPKAEEEPAGPKVVIAPNVAAVKATRPMDRVAESRLNWLTKQFDYYGLTQKDRERILAEADGKATQELAVEIAGCACTTASQRA